MRVYLVQRLLAPMGHNPFSFGGGKINGGINKEAMATLKTVFSFDYMGSAEFEWGAVPTALQALTNLVTVGFNLPTNNRIWVIAPIVIRTEVGDWIENASKGDHGHLKESLGLKRALEMGERDHIKGWLKIEDDRRCTEPFMFFVDEDMFKKTCELLGASIV